MWSNNLNFTNVWNSTKDKKNSLGKKKPSDRVSERNQTTDTLQICEKNSTKRTKNTRWRICQIAIVILIAQNKKYLRKFSKKHVKSFKCNASLSVTFRYFGMYPRLFRMVSDFLKIKLMRMSKNNFISRPSSQSFLNGKSLCTWLLGNVFHLYLFTFLQLILPFFFLEGWWWYCFKIWKSNVFRFCFFFGSFIFEIFFFFFLNWEIRACKQVSNSKLLHQTKRTFFYPPL